MRACGHSMNHSMTAEHLHAESRTPSNAWAFKSVFELSKTVTSSIKKSDASATSSPGQESRRLSSSFLSLSASAMKGEGSTPLALHGLTPGNFSPSAFFLDSSPANGASLSALAMANMSATGEKARPLLSPGLSEVQSHLNDVRRPISFSSPSLGMSCPHAVAQCPAAVLRFFVRETGPTRRAEPRHVLQAPRRGEGRRPPPTRPRCFKKTLHSCTHLSPTTSRHSDHAASEVLPPPFRRTSRYRCHLLPALRSALRGSGVLPPHPRSWTRR